MEGTLNFSPTGIRWSSRGVNFIFSTDPAGPFSFRLHRRKIFTSVGQKIGEPRVVESNTPDWEYDGDSDDLDAQYPTDAKPNHAFRIDQPSFDPVPRRQKSFRLDLRELAEWYDGKAWIQITKSSTGEWHANLSSVPPGVKGDVNNLGAGLPQNVLNSRPVASSGIPQSVHVGATVTLDGSLSSDANNDLLTYKWTQTPVPTVTLSDATAEKPTFTAPAVPTSLTFELRVTDITKGLFHHNPGNGESTADSVTVTVTAP